MDSLYRELSNRLRSYRRVPSVIIEATTSAKMMRPSTIVGLLAMSAVLSMPVLAQDKIFVVDVQKVITSSKAGQKARQEVEAEVQRGETRLKSLKGELEALEKSIQKQAEVLSGAALEEKQMELRKKERALKLALEDQRDALERKNRTEIGKVVAKIDAIIKDLGKSGKYGIILEADPRSVLYYNDALDLSEKVVSMLDVK